jgi:hypothetical protein
MQVVAGIDVSAIARKFGEGIFRTRKGYAEVRGRAVSHGTPRQRAQDGQGGAIMTTKEEVMGLIDECLALIEIKKKSLAQKREAKRMALIAKIDNAVALIEARKKELLARSGR